MSNKKERKKEREKEREKERKKEGKKERKRERKKKERKKVMLISYLPTRSSHVSSSTRVLKNVVRVIKSRSVRWVGHVACMDYNKNAYRVLDGTPGKK
jgi:hypothetical protein